MHFEYAVDPGLMADLATARALGDRFGWTEGRLISEYPTGWKRLAYDAIAASGLQDVKKASLKRRLEKLQGSLVRRMCTHWDPGQAWLPQALEHHRAFPFHAIVAADGGSDAGPVISAEDDISSGSLWEAPGGVVRRSADDLARAASLVISVSSRVLLIDPYLDPNDRRSRDSLAALFNTLRRPPLRVNRAPAIELHTTVKSYLDRGETADVERLAEYSSRFFRRCEERWADVIPADIRFSVTVWLDNDQRFHNRYVLTKLCGVGYPIGLDAAGEETQETDDLFRMTREQHETRWQEFTGTSRAFVQVAGPHLVAGTAPPVREATA